MFVFQTTQSAALGVRKAQLGCNDVFCFALRHGLPAAELDDSAAFLPDFQVDNHDDTEYELAPPARTLFSIAVT